MATTKDTPLRRADNFRRNLARVIDARSVTMQSLCADAGVTYEHLYRLLRGRSANPKLDTVESLCIALERSIEVMIADSPTDADLGIQKKSSADLAKTA